MSYISERAFSDCCNLSTVIIPNSVTEIGASAFEHCDALTFITIPESVTNIGSYSFYNCSNLTSITIPSSVKRIGEGAFRYTNIEKIVCLGSTPAALEDYNFDNKTVYVPKGAEDDFLVAGHWCNNAIVPYTLVDNFILSLVDESYLRVEGYNGIPDETSPLIIPSSAIWEGITFDVKEINDNAFENNAALTDVVIPNGIETIGSYAFSGCRNLRRVSLGESVSSIGTAAFSNCLSLTIIDANMAIPPSINEDVFVGVDKTVCTLSVSETAKAIFRSAAVWNEFSPFSVKTTEIDGLDYAVYAEPVMGIVGKQVTVKLDLKNINAIATWQTDIVLPKGFNIATDVFGDPMVTVSGSRTTSARHSIATNRLDDGLIRVLYNSSSNKTISDTDGEVATMMLNIDENVEPGDYPIIFKDLVLSEANEVGHRIDQVVSKISVMSYTPGDVNNDSDINAQDLVAVVNYILEMPIEGNIREAADLNEDGYIDAVDFVAEVNLILNIKPDAACSPALRRAAAMENGHLDGTLGMNTFTLLPGERSEVPVSLQQTDGAYTCGQFDLMLPEGVRLVEAESPLHSHSVAFRTLANGATRVLLSSTSNRVMPDTDDVLRFTFETDDDLQSGLYDLTLDRALFVTPEGEATSLTSLSVSFTVGDATVIFTPEADTESIRYNLSGQRVNISEQGVVIINGKKQYIK